MTITSDQWNQYLDKYGKLLHMISRRISGDPAISDHSDNYSDLCVSALNSIEGFHKKTGMSFDEMIQEKLFDQYTKTVLWNTKNKKGSRITKKMPMINKTISIESYREENDMPFDIEDTKAGNDEFKAMLEMFGHIDDDTKKIIGVIAQDPSVLTEQGRLKVTSLVGPTGLTIHRVRKCVERIEDMLGSKYLETE